MELRAAVCPARLAAGLALGLAIATAAAAPAAADDLRVPASPTTPPPLHRLSARQAIAIANRQPKVRSERTSHGPLRPIAYTKGSGGWQVSYFHGASERAQVLIDDASGRVLEAWTGAQVAWQMARGYPGAFGGKADALYVWLPLCAVFLAPFIDRRRPLRMLHLDLIALLAFSVSLAFFNHARIGASVPLVYPVLCYLLARLLYLGFRRPRRVGRLVPHIPLSWVALALVFLVGFRVALNIADSGVIDVGYAGVIGAHRIASGKPLYSGTFARDNDHGDTYGPVVYLTYLPFEEAFGWSGRWDSLPAAHAAALAFDLLTMLGLFVLGRRLRAGPGGRELGLALAFAWASYPFTLFTLDSNSNDSLVALLLVAMLLALTSPRLRGLLLGLAAAAKFAPIALLPLIARGTERFRRLRGALLASLAACLVVAGAFAPFIPHHGIARIWHRTLGYQITRHSPFSIWGQYPAIGWLWTAAKVAAGGLALAVALTPRRHSRVQWAALAAAVLCAIELCAAHWFYLYIVWFLPAALVALLAPQRMASEPPAEPARTVDRVEAEREPVLA